MILQLDPMIPVYSTKHEMKGFAFLVIDYSQEHDLYFAIALENGEIWTLNNKYVKFQHNTTLDRNEKSI